MACESPGGAVCYANGDCASGSCVGGVCAAESCGFDSDCSAGFCDAGKCTTKLREAGEVCNADAWCTSNHCVDHRCHGTLRTYDACQQHYECADDAQCCPNPSNQTNKTCGLAAQGCPGGNGGPCGVLGAKGCISQYCAGYYLCTQACSKDADCGISPWGTQNYCAQSKGLCFAGCSNDGECFNHLRSSFVCRSVLTTSGSSAKVCAGTANEPSELQP